MEARNVRNERLAEAMARAGKNSTALAAVLEVDPKTVERWVADATRNPRASSRHKVADELHVPAAMLWPGATNGSQMTDELAAVYPSRAAMPSGIVMSLLGAAQREVGILALAAIYLWDAVPEFAQTLAAKARAGVRVRLCLGDPAGDAIRVRGAEEGIGTSLAGRCELAAKYARPVLDADPESLRLHDTTLYASILRFDDDLLVNWHLFGVPASAAPVLHLRHTSSHGLAETVARSFERVWEGAQPAIG